MERGIGPDDMLEHDDINISDVIEVIEHADPDFNNINNTDPLAPNTTPTNTLNTKPMAGPSTSSGYGAYVEIIEQPASKAMRFRYECEGRSAGSIPGQSSTPENKTFPTIAVRGYKGKAVVVVSCVTKDKPYRPHPHNLVGKEGCKKGVCTVEIPSDTMTVSFSNLGIRCVKKKDIEDALRTREEIRVDPFRTGFSHRTQPSSIDLNAVRLCFQVFLQEENGKFSIPLTPVVSEPIYDKKAMSDLQIFRLSSESASVAGGTMLMLFCEKVTKDDIKIRFFEEKSGQVVWDGFADFQPADVHRQVGIAFTTPKYHTLEITEPVEAFIQLFRPSDSACSEPLRFTFTPLQEAEMKRKRTKISSETPNNYYRVQQLQGVVTKSSSPSFGGILNVACDTTVKTEPREIQNKMYGGGLNPYSPNSLDAMQYRAPLSVSPKRSPSSMDYHNDTSCGEQYHSPSPLNIPPSPQDPLRMDTNTMQATKWNIPIKQDRSFQSNPQWNILTSPYHPQDGGVGQWTQTFGVTNNDQIVNVVGGEPINNIDEQSALGNVVYDLDSQELTQLNSADIADGLMFDNQLSENLSNNLNIVDPQPDSTTPQNDEQQPPENMTDSFTRLVNTTINDLCSLNKM